MNWIIPTKLFRSLLVFSLLFNGLNTIRLGILKHYGINLNNSSWGNLILYNLVFENLLCIVLFVCIVYLTKVLMFKFKSWRIVIVFHFILSIAIFTLLYFGYGLYLHLFKGLEGNQDIGYYVLNVIINSKIYFLIYFTNTIIVYNYYYLEQNRRMEIQNLKLNEQLTLAKNNILKYQLHPHFFFNTLNNISSLIDVDKKLAQNTLADFSELLRDIVNLKDTNFMSIAQEVDILRRYIDLMKIRFTDHLKINLNVDNGLEHILIPSFLIQPILENSFKYGYSPAHSHLKIDVSIKKNNGNIEIFVANNGSPLPEVFQYGTGLQNTIKRLQTLYGNNYSFNINNQLSQKGVITKLAFPIKTNG